MSEMVSLILFHCFYPLQIPYLALVNYYYFSLGLSVDYDTWFSVMSKASLSSVLFHLLRFLFFFHELSFLCPIIEFVLSFTSSLEKSVCISVSYVWLSSVSFKLFFLRLLFEIYIFVFLYSIIFNFKYLYCEYCVVYSNYVFLELSLSAYYVCLFFIMGCWISFFLSNVYQLLLFFRVHIFF